MPLVLPGQVSPRSGNVAVRKGARVVATSPGQAPSRSVHSTSRFGLGFANERRQCPVGSKAHEHVDLISHYGLSDDVKGVAESGSPDALHHDLYVLSTDASLPPPGVAT